MFDATFGDGYVTFISRDYYSFSAKATDISTV